MEVFAGTLQQIRRTLGLERAAGLNVHEIRAKAFRCPLCGPSVLVQLCKDEVAVRCIRCRATAITMSIVHVLGARFPDLRYKRVYELSARGPLREYLRRRAGDFMCSQYINGAASGSYIDGARVEDVQKLTFASGSFDLCTCTEVFEHVPNDRRAFRELHRVLKPGGSLIFTVPISVDSRTVERASIANGKTVHFATPQYHRDPAAGHRPILAFRDYGLDIVARLNEAGFAEAEIVIPDVAWFNYRRPVIVGRK